MKKVVFVALLSCYSANVFAQTPEAERPTPTDAAAGLSKTLNECLGREVNASITTASLSNRLSVANNKIAELEAKLKELQPAEQNKTEEQNKQNKMPLTPSTSKP